MSIISISRNTQNNVCIVSMISTDSLATVASANYIFNQMANIRALNFGAWDWFASDIVACSASNGNAFFTFTDATFHTLAQYGATSGTFLPLAGGTMSGAINMGGFPINNAANPTLAQDLATKSYVDSQAQGITVQGAVYAATVANLTGYTYNNGAAGVGATLTAGSNAAFVLDGTSPALNARILVKNQSSSVQNGIYVLSQVGDGSNPAILTRASDYDLPSQIQPGDLVIVNAGLVNHETSWLETATVVTIGTDPINFSLFTASTFSWSVDTSSPIAVIQNTGHIANSASLISYVLPTTCPVGGILEFAARGTGGLIVTQSSGQQIIYGNKSSTLGAGGSIASSLPGDAIRMVCSQANNEFFVLSSVGNLTVV